MGWGFSPQNVAVKHSPADELCEIFKFCSFLQSKCVNNVCKLLQLLGTEVPRGSLGYRTQMNIPGASGAAAGNHSVLSCLKHVLQPVRHR